MEGVTAKGALQNTIKGQHYGRPTTEGLNPIDWTPMDWTAPMDCPPRKTDGLLQ